MQGGICAWPPWLSATSNPWPTHQARTSYSADHPPQTVICCLALASRSRPRLPRLPRGQCMPARPRPWHPQAVARGCWSLGRWHARQPLQRPRPPGQRSTTAWQSARLSHPQSHGIKLPAHWGQRCKRSTAQPVACQPLRGQIIRWPPCRSTAPPLHTRMAQACASPEAKTP